MPMTLVSLNFPNHSGKLYAYFPRFSSLTFSALWANQNLFSMAHNMYNCLVKIGPEHQSVVTYHRVTDLARFHSFISREYPDWRFFNVYANYGKRKPRGEFLTNWPKGRGVPDRKLQLHQYGFWLP